MRMTDILLNASISKSKPFSGDNRPAVTILKSSSLNGTELISPLLMRTVRVVFQIFQSHLILID